MRHEKIIKREDGSKVLIRVSFSTTNYSEGYNWGVDVLISAANKRKFTNVVNTDDYEYRQQSFPHGRNAWAVKKQLEYVTPDELLQAKLELWEMLKPELTPTINQ